MIKRPSHVMKMIRQLVSKRRISKQLVSGSLEQVEHDEFRVTWEGNEHLWKQGVLLMELFSALNILTLSVRGSEPVVWVGNNAILQMDGNQKGTSD